MTQMKYMQKRKKRIPILAKTLCGFFFTKSHKNENGNVM